MKLFFKIIGGLFWVWLIITGALIAMNWSLVTQLVRYSPIVIPAMYGAPETVAEAREQDLRFLRNLLKYDRSFSDSEQAAFLKHIEDLEARAGALSDAELFLGVARAVAITNNGHTNISTGPLYRKFNHANVKFFWFADGLFIVRTHNSLAELVGSRVTAINGRPTDDVVTALAPYFGGVPHWRRLFATYYMESPEMMHAAGLASSPDELSLTVTNQSGAEETITLPSVKRENGDELPSRRPWMTLKPVALPDEGEAWRRTLDLQGADAPIYLRDIDENFLWTELQGGVYVRPQLLLQSKEMPILEQFQAVLNAADDGEFDFMAIDLRWSPGGDYTKVIDFVKAAPGVIKSNGRLYIIVGPQTFSAALVTAAFLKFYGGENAVIIGSPMGDAEQFWAERGPLPFELPNSKFSVSFATGYHDWANGCAGKHEYCFSQNLTHEVPAGSLQPAIPMEATYAEYASGEDIIMDYILSGN